MVRLRRDSTTAIARELARFCHLLTAAARLMYDQKYDPNVWSAAPHRNNGRGRFVWYAVASQQPSDAM